MIENEGKYDSVKLAELMDTMADGNLTEVQEKELQRILKSNKDARQLYLETIQTEDSLYWNNAESSIPAFTEQPHENKKVEVSSKIPLFAIAAILVVGFIILGNLKPFSNPAPVELATVHEGPGVVWDMVKVDQRLKKGKYKILSGIVDIVFDSGTKMKVFSPAEFEIISYNHARVNRGEVRINVPQQALGFRLETEAANFVDIGTEFSIKVNDSDVAEIHVLAGVVVAKPKRGQMIVSFGKNESGRIEPIFGEVSEIPSRYKALDPLAPDLSQVKYPKLPAGSKVIFLGDRNTDFETYLHMVNQAIFDAEPEKAISLMNAGMTLRFYNKEEEFKELVVDLKPTHAVVAFGPEIAANDGNKSIHRVEPNDFEKQIRNIVKGLKQNAIKPIIMTGFPMNTRNPVCIKLLEAYNRILRQIAAEGGFPLAEADEIYKLYKNHSMENKLVDSEQKYCTFEGYKLMARSILNSFGYSGLRVPDKLRFGTMPGLIKEWYASDAYLRSDLLSVEKVKTLNYKSWSKILLPQPAEDKISERLLIPHQIYPVQARSLGVAMSITNDWRNKTRAVAEVYCEAAGIKYLNLGEDIKTVWVNGKLLKKELLGIYVDGRHPGFYRLPVQFKKGENIILIEAQNSFFVSVTDIIDWGLPKPSQK